MSIVVREPGVIRLCGHCGSEDAEPLLQQLLASPEATVDWSECEGAHTAVVQLILAAGRRPAGSPNDEFLRRWVEPLVAPR